MERKKSGRRPPTRRPRHSCTLHAPRSTLRARHAPRLRRLSATASTTPRRWPATSVGIAVGSGTDIAAEAGDIVLMGEPLRHLPLLLRLSRETMRIIRQNIIVYRLRRQRRRHRLDGHGCGRSSPRRRSSTTSPHWLASSTTSSARSLVLLNSMRLLAFERARKQDAYALEGPLQTVRSVDGAKPQCRSNRPWPDRIVGSRSQLPMEGVTVTAWALSGLIAVEPDEVRIVQRFGRVGTDLGPGCTGAGPGRSRPCVPSSRTKSKSSSSISSRVRKATTTRTWPLQPEALTWTSAHGDQRRPAAAAMLTGDNQLIEVLASVLYTIDNPREYLFGSRQPKAILRSATESVLREVVVGKAFVELLTVALRSFRTK